jgi:hypothetical protein
MASEGSLKGKSRVVAEVASKLFSFRIDPSSVIVETLERVTDSAKNATSVRPALGPAIDAGLAPTIPDHELRTHPLTVWVETRLGVSWSEIDQRWVRARPLTVEEAARALSEDAGRDVAACRAALRTLLLVSSIAERERTGSPDASARSFFAFKLHQFISGAGHAYATLEAPGQRSVTVDGQQFLPGDPSKRLYPVHFCRECGHEYHPVKFVNDAGDRRFLARDIDDAPPARPDDDDESASDDTDDPTDREAFGFVTPHAADFSFDDREEDYPETWLEYDSAGSPRLKATYRMARARSVNIAPDGRVGPGARAWFSSRASSGSACAAEPPRAAQPATATASPRSRPKVEAPRPPCLSAARCAGCTVRTRTSRSTAASSGFTDNRQDAALQSGHFNDFLFVSLIRAGFLGALENAGEQGLRSDELGVAQQRRWASTARAEIRAEWLLEPSLKGFNLQEAESTLRQVLSYRVWFDQRRGWRYTNPNLEQLGWSRSTTSVSTRWRPTSGVRDGARCTPARIPSRAGRGLPRATRSPAQVDGDPQPGVRADRCRADARAVAQSLARALGLRHRREAASGSVAHGLAALAQATRRCATRTSSCAADPAARSASCCARRPRPAVDGSGTIAPRCARSSPRTSTPSSWRSFELPASTASSPRR